MRFLGRGQQGTGAFAPGQKSLDHFFVSMDKMARYQTSIGRQVARDITDLKRLQKERKQAEEPEDGGVPGEQGGER